MAENSFSIGFAEFPFTLEDPSTGEVKSYVLREMDGVRYDAYMHEITSRVDITPSGEVSGIQNISGVGTSLVAESVFDAAGERVAPGVLATWPNRVLRALADEARKLNDMERDDDEDPSGN